MRLTSMLPLFMAQSVACAAAGPAPTAPPSEVFDRYVSAVHAGDMQAVRDLISPDVERSDFAGCRPEMDNLTCLAHYIEATVVKPRARITERARSVQGDTVDAVLEVRSPLYTQAGVERILGRDIVRVRNGRIVAFRFVPDFADEPTVTFFGKLGIGPRAAGPATKP
jgi:ketosteroid isomerase-like protein